MQDFPCPAEMVWNYTFLKCWTICFCYKLNPLSSWLDLMWKSSVHNSVHNKVNLCLSASMIFLCLLEIRSFILHFYFLTLSSSRWEDVEHSLWHCVWKEVITERIKELVQIGSCPEWVFTVIVCGLLFFRISRSREVWSRICQGQSVPT